MLWAAAPCDNRVHLQHVTVLAIVDSAFRVTVNLRAFYVGENEFVSEEGLSHKCIVKHLADGQDSASNHIKFDAWLLRMFGC